MTAKLTIPAVTAPAALLEVRYVSHDGSGRAWRLTVRCPHCGAVHTHGAGSDPAGPDLTHRPLLQRCTVLYGGRPGYAIVDPSGLANQAVIRP